jgi:hypothetical protein
MTSSDEERIEKNGRRVNISKQTATWVEGAERERARRPFSSPIEMQGSLRWAVWQEQGNPTR